MSDTSPCKNNPCSHLCLIVPRGYRCACPDGQTPGNLNGRCDSAAFEQPKAEPLKCPCRNGGSCDPSSGVAHCRCKPNFEGSRCEEYIPRSRIYGQGGNNVFMSLFVVLLVFVIAGILFVVFKKKNFINGKPGFGNHSVSFRSGTNVEFNGPNFHRDSGVPLEGDFHLGEFKSTDFTNPMYGMDPSESKDPSASRGGVYEVPEEDLNKGNLKQETSFERPAVDSAVLSPSSIVHKSSPHVTVRQKSFNPTSVETDKDTQKLVEEDNDL